MKMTFKSVMPFAGVLLFSGIASAQTAQTTWTDFSGSQSFNANTLAATFSSATMNGPNLVVQATGGNPESFVLNSSSPNPMLTLDLTATSLTTLTGLTVDMDRTSFTSGTLQFYWYYSINGGAASQITTVFLTGGGWHNETIDVSSVPVLNPGDQLAIYVNNQAPGYPIGFDNVAVSSVPEPGSFVLAGMGAVAVLGLRCRRKL